MKKITKKYASLALMLLVAFAIFPKAAALISKLVGTMSTANFIFLLVIFLLTVKLFSMSMRISQLETKLMELVQRIAIDDNERNRGEDLVDKNQEDFIE